MDLEPNDLARLRSQASRGELILFTGAGFSLAARNHAGVSLPTTGELKREVWSICYPSAEFDESSSLGDLFGAALRKSRAALNTLIQSRLSVDPDTLPNFYRAYFDFPWLRCYTLNVDDLDSAVARRFQLRRSPDTIAATVGSRSQEGSRDLSRLEVIHLNGVIPGPLESLTFSERQYAERISNQEPWYARCIVDITSRPVIFIGTVLSESLLWHHMCLRARRENLGRDLRPTSLLVTTELPLPRQDLLRELRIEWVHGTAEQFALEVLPHLQQEAERGFVFLGQISETRASDYIPLVRELAEQKPALQTEYLLGDEPQWADVLQGRAVERSHDAVLHRVAAEILEGKRPSTALAVTGTAGSGKSTALMSLALKLTTAGGPVLWIDKDSEASPLRIRNRVRRNAGPLIVAIDDADLFGRDLAGLLRDLVPHTENFLFVFAIRSIKLDELTNALSASGDVTVHEHVVPPLTDPDIDVLIAVLEKNNRLGLLTGATQTERRAAFRVQAGRQLLVAMIQATSGENFERKAVREYEELDELQRYSYALISVATALRYTLAKDEVILAHGESSNEGLIALDRLAARHLVNVHPRLNEYRCRHRVIADLVFDCLVQRRELFQVLEGLTWALASKVNPHGERRSRTHQFLAKVLKHDFLHKSIGIMSARDLYTGLESILSWDYHYWLQRGSLEVEYGDVRRAENFLGAAKSLGGGDYRVKTAYGYMLMRKAVELPQNLDAEELVETGAQSLEEIIENFGTVTEYPYHVLGSQSLAWCHRCSWNPDKRNDFLKKIIELVRQGLKSHPTSQSLARLLKDLKTESLRTVVDRRAQ